MKYYNKIRCIISSLFLSISMTSASQRSWTDSFNKARQNSSKRMSEKYEAGKEYLRPAYDNYARPIYNYVKNHPYKTGAGIFVAGGLVYGISYAVRNRKTLRKALSAAAYEIEAGFKDARDLTIGSFQEDQKKILAQIQEYNELSKKANPNQDENKRRETLFSDLFAEYQKYSALEARSEIESEVLQHLQRWRFDILNQNITQRTPEEKEEYAKLALILKK